MNSSPPSPPLLSVVVAAYDEAGNVGELVERLGATLRGLTGWRWEIVFVVSGAARAWR